MNQSNLENNKFITASLLILALVAVAFTLNFTKPIMIPFVMALLIRILIDPIIDFQTTNLRVHRIVAVFVSLILIVILFIIIVPFIIGSVGTFLESADDYNAKVLVLIDYIINQLSAYDVEIDREIIRNTLTTLPFLDWASTILSNSANFISKFVLVVIMTLFLLLGKKSIAYLLLSIISLLLDKGLIINILFSRQYWLTNFTGLEYKGPIIRFILLNKLDFKIPLTTSGSLLVSYGYNFILTPIESKWFVANLIPLYKSVINLFFFIMDKLSFSLYINGNKIATLKI